MPLIEDLVAGKKSLGADFRFERNTLEIKPNKHGINGVFTRHALPEGTEIISVPKTNGSLTPFRAYEEAQELLQRLGADRFNLKDRFVLACAMYLRCTNPETKQTDLLVTEPDLKAAYHGSPMSAYGSLDRAKLLYHNDELLLGQAAEVDNRIQKLNIDSNLFRALLGYVSSRMWDDGLGIIPIFDWLNASYGNGANCEFTEKNGFITFILLKDAHEDEELVWNYNAADAVITWLNYGYIDKERPTHAYLSLHTNAQERVALENFAVNALNLKKQDITPNSKIDNNIFDFILYNPGQLSTPALIRNALSRSIKQFADVRYWFRALLLSKQGGDFGSVTPAKLESDDLIFGLDFEKNVIARMRTALKDGLAGMHERVVVFKKSEVGQPIDMQPYTSMIESANAAWEDALATVEMICATEDTEKCIPIINNALDLNIQSVDEIKQALETVDLECPTLKASLVQKYMQVRI